MPIISQAVIQKDIAALTKEYEQKIKDQEAAQAEVLRQQLKAKLVALAGMAKNRMRS